MILATYVPSPIKVKIDYLIKTFLKHRAKGSPSFGEEYPHLGRFSLNAEDTTVLFAESLVNQVL
jgi:hypothetical protein